MHDDARADDGLVVRLGPVFGELFAGERRGADQIHREARGGVRQSGPIHRGRHAVEQAGPVADLIGLG